VSAPTLAPTDLLPLEDLAQRLRLSPKTVKRLSKEAGLPLFRLTPTTGRLYAFWPDVARWIRKRAMAVN
jgi:hypothetical protein